MKATLTGTVKSIGPVKEFNGGFCAQEVVVTYAPSPTFSTDIPFNFTRNKSGKRDIIKLIDECGVGELDIVEITYEPRGREHEGRYYVNLDASGIVIREKCGDGPTHDEEPF